MPVQAKICGINSPEALTAALKGGARYVGFVFYPPSPRYVPPPLEGIFTRYPYLHNQSVPTLCELLRPAKWRTAQFWMGPDANAATDYDPGCVGLPVGAAIPDAWKNDPQNQMDTTQPGLSNQGHEAMLLDANGNELLTATQRADLIAFLKTL